VINLPKINSIEELKNEVVAIAVAARFVLA
jgi:hypothetical protein